MSNNNISTEQSEDNAEVWMNRYFLKACAITYIIIVLFDFLLAPILFGIYSFHFQDHMMQSWNPLTLQGGGLFHVSFGTILSLGKWGHSKEQIANIENQTPQIEAPIKRL